MGQLDDWVRERHKATISGTALDPGTEFVDNLLAGLYDEQTLNE
jgi:hypothetical protein